MANYPNVYAEIEAYCDGVNDYLDKAAVRPPEYIVLGAKPEHWKPVDVFLIQQALNFQLSANADDELERLRVKEVRGLGNNMTRFYPEWNYEEFPTILHEGEWNLNCGPTTGGSSRRSYPYPYQPPVETPQEARALESKERKHTASTKKRLGSGSRLGDAARRALDDIFSGLLNLSGAAAVGSGKFSKQGRSSIRNNILRSMQMASNNWVIHGNFT